MKYLAAIWLAALLAACGGKQCDEHAQFYTKDTALDCKAVREAEDHPPAR